MKRFLYITRPVTPDLIECPKPTDALIISEHLAYLHERVESGEVLLVGPCTDGSGEFIVLQAESRHEAEALIHNDPAIIHGLMTAELRPYQVRMVAEEIFVG